MLKQLKVVKFGMILSISIILTLGASISLQSLFAAWTAPSANPPENNIEDLTVGGGLGVDGNVGILGNFLVSDTKMALFANSATGNVGIGTTDPYRLLTIKGSVAVLRFQDDDANGALGEINVNNNSGSIVIDSDISGLADDSFTSFQVHGSEKMRIKANGNVVFVGNTIDFDGQEIRHASFNPLWINSNDTIQFRINTNSDNGSGEFGVNRGNDNARIFTIKDDGKVGIGTTIPASSLHMASINPKLTIENNKPRVAGVNESSSVIFRGIGAYNQQFTTGEIVATSDNRDDYLRSGLTFRVYEGNAGLKDALTIDQLQRVGIGLNGGSPSAQLHVKSNSSAAQYAAIIDNPNPNTGYNNGGLQILTAQTTGTTLEVKSNGTSIFNILSNGNVGIGKNDPSTKLEVNGMIKSTGMQMTTGAGVGKVLTSDASGNGTWQTAGGSGAVKAWVVFDTNGTILRSYKVSSVSHVSTGVYDIYFTNPTGTNYSFTAIAGGSSGWAADQGAGLCTSCGSPSYGMYANRTRVLTGHSVSVPLVDRPTSVIFFGD